MTLFCVIQCSAVFIERRLVTNRKTDGQTDGQTQGHSIAWRGENVSRVYFLIVIIGDSFSAFLDVA